MSLGEQLLKNNLDMEIRKNKQSLKGVAKELDEFLEKAWTNIEADIQSGYPVDKIDVPAYLEFQKNYHKKKDEAFRLVVKDYRNKAFNENIELDFVAMPDDAFARHGGYDFWLTVKPYFPPAPDKN